MNVKFAAATLATTLFATGAAFAQPMYIHINGADATPAPGTDGYTAEITEWGVHFNATSTFTDTDGVAGLTVGDTVVDSGFGTILYLGEDTNQIVGLEANEGAGVFHQLRFSYDNMTGTVAYAGEQGVFGHYTSGDINVFMDDLSGGPLVHVATFGVNDSSATLANSLIQANVTWAMPNVFFFADGSDWSAIQLPSQIALRIDSNVDATSAPLPTGVAGEWRRTSRLDGSVQFTTTQIPEPGVLALLGLGLVGFGVARRSRKV